MMQKFKNKKKSLNMKTISKITKIKLLFFYLKAGSTKSHYVIQRLLKDF